MAVVGDGGFLMNGAQELGTAIANGIDLTIVVLNDNAYGMIQWKQAGPLSLLEAQSIGWSFQT